MSLRLDKRGQFVVCGMTDCGARVGHRGTGAHRLVLVPGYRRDPDDIVRMPPKAIGHRRSGRYAGGVPHGLRAVRGGRSGNDGTTGLSPALPARVACWDCGFVHDADAAALRVAPVATDVFIATNEEFGNLR